MGKSKAMQKQRPSDIKNEAFMELAINFLSQ